MKDNITKYMRKSIIICVLLAAMPLVAQQSAFDRFKQQQNDKFDKFKTDQQAEFDAFRKRINEEYAEHLRKAWETFPIHEAEKPKKEPEVKPIESPKPTIETKPVEIPVKPKVLVVPEPQPAPEPIAPVKPKEEPFNEMSLLPISMTQNVKETLFAKDYVGEKLKIYVDNLNVLYVAFTRAKGNLIIVGERTNSKGSAESANYVVEKCLPIDWMNKTDDEYGTYHSIGSIVPSKTEKKKETDEQPNVLTVEPVAQQTKFVTQPMKASFRQSNRATEFAQGNDEQDDDRKRYLNEGVLFHYLLSLLRTPEDLPAAVKRMDFEGYFSNETYRNEVMQLVEKALSTSQAREWFDDHWQVINECTILYRDDQGVVRQRRPDRVVTDGTQTIVIDYKTGRQDNEHIDQVGFYKQKLMEMGYPNVSGYVWYIRRGDIVQVP